MKAASYGFSKTLLCPSSEELLSFIVARLSPNERCNLAAHLAECSFCDAELRFLSKYPPSPSNVRTCSDARPPSVVGPLPALGCRDYRLPQLKND